LETGDSEGILDKLEAKADKQDAVTKQAGVSQ